MYDQTKNIAVMSAHSDPAQQERRSDGLMHDFAETTHRLACLTSKLDQLAERIVGPRAQPGEPAQTVGKAPSPAKPHLEMRLVQTGSLMAELILGCERSLSQIEEFI